MRRAGAVITASVLLVACEGFKDDAIGPADAGVDACFCALDDAGNGATDPFDAGDATDATVAEAGRDAGHPGTDADGVDAGPTSTDASGSDASGGDASLAHVGVLDNAQLTTNGDYGGRTFDTVWQSFIASHTGTLTEIDFGPGVSGDGWLDVHDGDVAGAVLQSRTVVVAPAPDAPVSLSEWAVSVPVTAGHTYTFQFTPDPRTVPDGFDVKIVTPSPIAGAQAGQTDPGGASTPVNPPSSFQFRTWIAPADGG